jgi:hypothetical protein
MKELKIYAELFLYKKISKMIISELKLKGWDANVNSNCLTVLVEQDISEVNLFSIGATVGAHEYLKSITHPLL